MSGLALHQLQKSVYSNLKSSPDLSVLLTGVFDQPPTGTKQPYIIMADTSTEPFNTKTTLGSRINFDLHIWSAQEGQTEAKEIMALIDASLTEKPLHVEGFQLVTLSLSDATTERQIDEFGGLTFGRMTYRATLIKQ